MFVRIRKAILFILILCLSVFSFTLLRRFEYRKIIFNDYNFTSLDSINEEIKRNGFSYKGNFSDIQSKNIFFDRIYVCSQEYNDKIYLIFLLNKNKLKYVKNQFEKKLSESNANCTPIGNIYLEKTIGCYEGIDKLYYITEINQYYKIYITNK